MNWDQVEGNWKQLKGKAKQQWGKFTDDELDVIAGKKDELIGKLQERYGMARQEAEREANLWREACECCRRGPMTARSHRGAVQGV
jgi:uncharacterized protein YjbJ (UPF0337 family)